MDLEEGPESFEDPRDTRDPATELDEAPQLDPNPDLYFDAYLLTIFNVPHNDTKLFIETEWDRTGRIFQPVGSADSVAAYEDVVLSVLPERIEHFQFKEKVGRVHVDHWHRIMPIIDRAPKHITQLDGGAVAGFRRREVAWTVGAIRALRDEGVLVN